MFLIFVLHGCVRYDSESLVEYSGVSDYQSEKIKREW